MQIYTKVGNLTTFKFFSCSFVVILIVVIVLSPNLYQPEHIAVMFVLIISKSTCNLPLSEIRKQGAEYKREFL
jgi:hypothetical protein